MWENMRASQDYMPLGWSMVVPKGAAKESQKQLGFILHRQPQEPHDGIGHEIGHVIVFDIILKLYNSTILNTKL